MAALHSQADVVHSHAGISAIDDVSDVKLFEKTEPLNMVYILGKNLN